MATIPASPMFKVNRRDPELITPAKPTPHEIKPLSDIDDQDILRVIYPSAIAIFRQNPSMKGKDAVKVIKEAIGKALVFYYPFAGRLREWTHRKLAVECTGEGILFIEASAEASLQDFGDLTKFPFHKSSEYFLSDVPESKMLLDSPLMLIQVTRLVCGGFIFAIRYNHTMADGPGILQFLIAVGEIARGAPAPSVLPVWERHLFSARTPRMTSKHGEANGRMISPEDLTTRSFFFGETEISSLRRLVSPSFRNCSTYDLLTACIWKCRTIALQVDPKEETRLTVISNARGKFDRSLVPSGYYGNVFAIPGAVAKAGEIKKNPVEFTLELVRKAKAEVTEEYLQSLAEHVVIEINTRSLLPFERSFTISDLRNAGDERVDFGWGNAMYFHLLVGHRMGIPNPVSFFSFIKNQKGEREILFSICLPEPSMERFTKELNGMLRGYINKSAL